MRAIQMPRNPSILQIYCSKAGVARILGAANLHDLTYMRSGTAALHDPNGRCEQVLRPSPGVAGACQLVRPVVPGEASLSRATNCLLPPASPHAIIEPAN